MENQNIILTRRQAMERIIKYMAFKNGMDVQQAHLLMGQCTNETLSNMLGFINYIKDNTLEVTNTVIRTTIWNELNEFKVIENFFLPRTYQYNKYNHWTIL